MDVFLSDEQRVDVDADTLLSLARRVLEGERRPQATEVNILLVEEHAMTELNLRFMGEEGPTDVLAFPLEEDDDTGPDWPPGHLAEADDHPYLLGDVVICPTVAVAQSKQAGWALNEEMRLLLVHGLLHLIGHDHAEPTEAAKMEERQAYYLRLGDA